MTSLLAVKQGLQEPRVRLRPKGRLDLADAEEAVELAAGYGLTADPWQGGIVEGWLARRADGFLAAGHCGLAVPRQNGKNGAVEIAQLHKMVFQGRKILHTAHEVKTARKAFLRLKSFFENERKYPELAALVESIRQTNGQEAISLSSGGSVEVVARSRGSGRGFTVDDLFLDEAQELTDEQLEALLPTISSAPSGDPQIIYLGTPPPPESHATVFRRVRTEGVAGKNKRMCWDEWSIPDNSDLFEVMKAWRETAYETNPALGIRMRLATVEGEKAQMSVEGFARERFGWWGREGSDIPPLISKRAWSDLEIKPADVPSDGRQVFGVKFSLNGELVGLAAARRPDVGPIHVEGLRLEDASTGMGWAVEWLAERKDTIAQIVVDGKGSAETFIDALYDAGFPRRVKAKPESKVVRLLTAGEYTAAHAMFLEFVRAEALTWAASPTLTEQVGRAIKRDIGRSGGWGWGPNVEGEDVTLLDAATLAVYGAKTTRRKPSSGGGVVVL